MRARIISFRPDPDEPGAWIAELSCGHTRHVRHQPPFQERLWVLTPEGRERFMGAELQCPRCDEEQASRSSLPPETPPRSADVRRSG